MAHKVYWTGANAQRSAAAADQAVKAVRAALQRLNPHTSERELAAAKLRLRHPSLTLQQIADIHGMTKDEYASALGRFLRRHRPVVTT